MRRSITLLVLAVAMLLVGEHLPAGAAIDPHAGWMDQLKAPTTRSEVRAEQTVTGADAVGDVPSCEGDLRGVGGGYGDNGAIALAVDVVCPTSPTSANWVDGLSGIVWFIDVDGDNDEDYSVHLESWSAGYFQAQVFYTKGSAFSKVCDGQPSMSNSNYLAAFASSCIGDPASYRVFGAMLWDENPYGADCVCAVDHAPGTRAFMGPIARGDGSTPAPAPQPQPQPQPAKARQGYWMVGSTGETFAFGDAAHYGNAPTQNVVDLEPTGTGRGYWTVDATGHVFSFGDARYFGGVPTLQSGESVTALSRSGDSGGYWLFTNRGRVLSYGNAPFLGDMSGVALNGAVLDSIPTPSGQGYYMVGSDGGIFTFGDAAFFGSMGSTPLNAPVQSLVPDPDGTGYWLVASDGGIFAFESEFYGSMGSTKLNRPVTGMVGFGKGYLMVAEDGGIFTFGEAPFFGSLGSTPPSHPIVSAAILNQA